MLVCCSDSASKMGEINRQGPHHASPKSKAAGFLPLVYASEVSALVHSERNRTHDLVELVEVFVSGDVDGVC
jgi:hypothetical protein